MEAYVTTMLYRKCSILFLALFVFPHLDYAFEVDRDDDKNTNSKVGQNVTVSARLLCDGEPLENVPIQLWDIDMHSKNDLLSEQRTNQHGFFNITGHENEFFGLVGFVPFINITNVSCTVNCDKQWITTTFPKVEQLVHAFHHLGDIEMANVCANIYPENKLTLAELIAKSKGPEDYDTQYDQLMKLRWSSNARKEARQEGQTIGISGQLMCAGKPIQHLRVKLFHNNTVLWGRTDNELLNMTQTDANGRFVILGLRIRASGVMMPFLNFSNVNCNARCTGRTEFKFVLKEVEEEGISVLTLGTIDFASACLKQDLDLEVRHEDYDVSGRLTCGGKPLSGAHVALHESSAFFTYPTVEQMLVDANITEDDEERGLLAYAKYEQQLLDMKIAKERIGMYLRFPMIEQRLLDADTIDTGHFSLRTTEFSADDDLFLKISGITCGTKCNGNWLMNLALSQMKMLDRIVYDLGSMDMTYVCSTYDSGEWMPYGELPSWESWAAFRRTFNESTSSA